jgi:hypothetical protein
MPDIFEYFGLIFYFYSTEHNPPHVHVRHGSKESIFDLIVEGSELKEIRHRERKGYEPLSANDARLAETFITEYIENIVAKWVKYVVMGKQVRLTKITKKIEKKIHVKTKIKKKQ